MPHVLGSARNPKKNDEIKLDLAIRTRTCNYSGVDASARDLGND